MIKVPIFFQLNKLGLVGATKELKKLSNQTKSFGVTSKLSIGAATVALTAYTKKSIAAAMADQKAQATLSQTLKNVGRAYATVDVTGFIDKLQRATGVSEELLRPAFEKLVRATGDVTEAQKLLNLTLDISASTGKNTEQVSASLSKAFLGQTQALGRLGIGLSKADLKANSFEEITNKLTKLFSGQAAVAASTYAGQLSILQVSAQEASETIGTALIDSLSALAGEDGVKDLATQMESLAQSTANVITGLGEMGRLTKQFAGVATTIGAIALMLVPAGKLAKPAMMLMNVLKSKKFIGGALLAGGIGAAGKLGSNLNTPAQGTNRQSPRATENAAIKADAKARAKAIADSKTQLNLSKQTAANKKLTAMFDLDSIQITAALKGKISDLDRARLLAMQALKTEDKNDDIKALEDLEQAKISADAKDRARKIKALQDTIAFNKAALDDWQANFDKMNSNATKMLGLSAAAYSVGAPNSTYQTGLQQAQTDLFKGTFPNMDYANFDLGSLGAANAKMEAGIAAQQAANITVNVNPSGSGFIGNQDDFLRTVQMALQIGGRNGYSFTGIATG